MDLVGQILAAIGGLGSLVCFILVIIKMFQQGGLKHRNHLFGAAPVLRHRRFDRVYLRLDAE
jgi:hypothetical protein